MPNIDDLPVDILYEIHHLSLSPSLPSVNRYTHAVLSHPTTTRAAYWLIERYWRTGADAFLGRALECAVCDDEVLLEIERIWAREVAQAGTIKNGTTTEWFAFPARGENDPAPPRLECTTLPRRIFRHPRPTTVLLAQPIPPLLTHLFDKYTPSPNSHRGYPLARAVLHGDLPLIRFLRLQGADPAEKGFLAIEIALMRKDIATLRILIDGPQDDDPSPAVAVAAAATDASVPTTTKGKRKRASSDDPSRSTKRSRTSTTPRKSALVPVRLTQPVVDKALVKGSPEIIQYIVHEKGYMPSLREIVKMK
ncbi:hypothetical protein NCC49_005233 [Naganishia albida]|nr:hypothetical protein NCC49_005233 [Naganishia albida]